MEPCTRRIPRGVCQGDSPWSFLADLMGIPCEILWGIPGDPLGDPLGDSVGDLQRVPSGDPLGGYFREHGTFIPPWISFVHPGSPGMSPGGYPWRSSWDSLGGLVPLPGGSTVLGIPFRIYLLVSWGISQEIPRGITRGIVGNLFRGLK